MNVLNILLGALKTGNTKRKPGTGGKAGFFGFEELLLQSLKSSNISSRKLNSERLFSTSTNFTSECVDRNSCKEKVLNLQRRKKLPFPVYREAFIQREPFYLFGKISSFLPEKVESHFPLRFSVAETTVQRVAEVLSKLKGEIIKGGFSIPGAVAGKIEVSGEFHRATVVKKRMALKSSRVKVTPSDDKNLDKVSPGHGANVEYLFSAVEENPAEKKEDLLKDNKKPIGKESPSDLELRRPGVRYGAFKAFKKRQPRDRAYFVDGLKKFQLSFLNSEPVFYREKGGSERLGESRLEYPVSTKESRQTFSGKTGVNQPLEGAPSQEVRLLGFKKFNSFGFQNSEKSLNYLSGSKVVEVDDKVALDVNRSTNRKVARAFYSEVSPKEKLLKRNTLGFRKKNRSFPPGKLPISGEAASDRRIDPPVHFFDQVPGTSSTDVAFLLSDTAVNFQHRKAYQFNGMLMQKESDNSVNSPFSLDYSQMGEFSWSFGTSSGFERFGEEESYRFSDHRQENREPVLQFSYMDRGFKLFVSTHGRILNLKLNLFEGFQMDPAAVKEITSIIENSGFIPGKITLKQRRGRYALPEDRVDSKLELKV